MDNLKRWCIDINLTRWIKDDGECHTNSQQCLHCIYVYTTSDKKLCSAMKIQLLSIDLIKSLLLCSTHTQRVQNCITQQQWSINRRKHGRRRSNRRKTLCRTCVLTTSRNATNCGMMIRRFTPYTINGCYRYQNFIIICISIKIEEVKIDEIAFRYFVSYIFHTKHIHVHNDNNLSKQEI